MTSARIALWAAVLATALSMLFVWTQAARSHGDAMWIQVDPQYVTPMGGHCCGPVDCSRAPDGAVVAREPGKWHVPSTNQTFVQGEKGVYPAIRPGFWWCKRGQAVVCLFYEGGAS